MVSNDNSGEQKKVKRHDITRIRDDYYMVESQTTYRKYEVWLKDNKWYCNCPDNRYRNKHCKHIGIIENQITINIEKRQRNKITINPVIEDVVKNCPFCKSDKIKKNGTRKNTNYTVQRFFCHNCKKAFPDNLGFSHMKNSPKAITSAMHLYFSGESLRNTAISLKLLKVNVSHQTVYNWIKKYVKLMKLHLDKITPQVGDAWRADEIFMKIKGKLKYVFSMMDDETRFLIAQQVLDRKEGADATQLLQEAKDVTKRTPHTFTTDGLGSYHVAYKKVFWQMDRQKRTLHIRHIHLQRDMNNNKMERINGEIRDREKTMRGLKIKDSAMLKGYLLYHNYFRPHMALHGMTPAEKCGIYINGTDKWKTVIQNASQDTISC